MRHLVLLAALLTFATGRAESAPGFAFLRLGEGARDAALGEATVALTGPTADAANPAALSTGTRSVAFSHTQWLDAIRHEYASVLIPRGEDVIALSARLSHSNGIEHRAGPSVEPDGEFGVYEWTAGLTWSRPLGPHLRSGVSARFVRQSIFDEAASGGLVDAGLHYTRGDWQAGLALRNAGAMNDLDQDATDLPLQWRVGAARRLDAVWLTAAAHLTDGETDLHAGAEWQPIDRLRLRLGYDSTDTRGLSYGAGVELDPWRIDYAYLPFSEGLGPAHRISLVWAVDAGSMR